MTADEIAEYEGLRMFLRILTDMESFLRWLRAKGYRPVSIPGHASEIDETGERAFQKLEYTMVTVSNVRSRDIQHVTFYSARDDETKVLVEHGKFVGD